VIKALIDAGMLIARGRLKHQYPHSWRSKKPVIFRNTPQWFIAMDKSIADGRGQAMPGDTLRRRALAAIKQTRWVPPQGENRITGMVESRDGSFHASAPGVSITVFVREQRDGGVGIWKISGSMRDRAAFERKARMPGRTAPPLAFFCRTMILAVARSTTFSMSGSIRLARLHA
jgi:hypothetical protein